MTNSPFKAFEDLESISGKNDKHEYLKNISHESQQLFEAALDPFKIFYVTSLNIVCKPNSTNDDRISYLQLVSLLKKLQLRELTGNDAIKQVINTLSNFSPLAYKWALRILDKNLRVGLSEKSYLKIFPGRFDIFAVQLCDKWEGEPLIKWYAQPKFDGLRAIALYNQSNNTYEFFTRNGRPIFGVDHLQKPLLSLGKYIFDGEIFGLNFDDTIHNARTQNNTISELRYYVFDIMSTKEWKNQKCDNVYKQRYDLLSSILSKNPQSYIELVDNYIVTEEKDPAYWMKKFTGDKYEGVVLKDPNSLYVWKRAKTWLKGKLMDSYDLKIVGAVAGEGRLEGTLGALIVEHKGVKTHVGTGFTDDDRIKLWARSQNGDLIGKTVEVQCQETTKTYALRFPAFIKMRPDKD